MRLLLLSKGERSQDYCCVVREKGARCVREFVACARVFLTTMRFYTKYKTHHSILNIVLLL